MLIGVVGGCTVRIAGRVAMSAKLKLHYSVSEALHDDAESFLAAFWACSCLAKDSIFIFPTVTAETIAHAAGRKTPPLIFKICGGNDSVTF